MCVLISIKQKKNSLLRFSINNTYSNPNEKRQVMRLLLHGAAAAAAVYPPARNAHLHMHVAYQCSCLMDGVLGHTKNQFFHVV